MSEEERVDEPFASDDPLKDLSQEQRHNLEHYLDELMAANAQFNLTAIRSRADAWERHIVESAKLAPLLGNPKTMLDVGSGGGLPGLVLAICRPDISVTLLEATEKKALFLERTAKALGLSHVTVLCARAEAAGAAGSAHREKYELVIARAVAPLRTLLEITLPFLKVNGTLIAVKGEKAATEVAEAGRALQILSGRVAQTMLHPSGTILFIEKTAPTQSKYPRRAGEPKHRPL